MTRPKGPYRQLAPGLYVDRDGAAVCNVAEVVMAMGMEDTPDNRRLVGQELVAMVQGVFMDGGIYLRGPGESDWRALG